MVNEDQYRYNPYNRDRPRGVLTQGEREYLAGESDIEPKSAKERRTRQQIRNRVREAILDFRVLFDNLEKRDRDMIFSAEVDTDTVPDEFYQRSSRGLGEIPPEELETVETGWIHGSSTYLIGFAFQHYDNIPLMESRVEEALQNVIYHHGFDSTVEVSIDVDYHEGLDSIESRLEQDGPATLTETELRTLKDAGRITDLEHAEFTLERAKQQEEKGLHGTTEQPDRFGQDDESDTEADKD